MSTVEENQGCADVSSHHETKLESGTPPTILDQGSTVSSDAEEQFEDLVDNVLLHLIEYANEEYHDTSGPLLSKLKKLVQDYPSMRPVLFDLLHDFIANYEVWEANNKASQPEHQR